ncbi:MAG: TIGR03620 family F420-dependent LLM class oxidoreductase [Pseudonocardia sp.]|nr:TIGR03620 family F420-dependent LLM class oxidoreductase [Pseudonocardia sp.]
MSGGTGVVLHSEAWARILDAAPELENLGYSSLWLPGPLLTDLDRIGAVVRTTRRALVSTAVLPADQFDAGDVASSFAALERDYPGRALLGLGGAHGPRPLRTVSDYMDRLDHADSPVPAAGRVLAALGPRMLDLARERSSGALPLFTTPEYTAGARKRLGPDLSLIVQLAVVLDAHPARGRDTAREMVGFLRDVEVGYRRHFARMGFSDADVAGLNDQFIDALVPHGDVAAISRRIDEQRAAGADHVALMVLPGDGDLLDQWRSLAQVAT